MTRQQSDDVYRGILDYRKQGPMSRIARWWRMVEPAPMFLQEGAEVDPHVVAIDYTNHRGERSWRMIKPSAMFYTNSQWHPERQWMIEAFDITKKANRLFAMTDIHAWALPLVPPPSLHDRLQTMAEQAKRDGSITLTAEQMAEIAAGSVPF